MKKNAINPETLRKILRYDPITGKLYWRPRSVEMFASLKSCRTWNTRFSGKEAVNTVSFHGYKVGEILSKKYKAHRVIWAMNYGAWPKFQIDHIDGNKINNLLQNLRDVNQSMNQRNAKRRIDNTTGHCGVTKHKPTNKWRAEIWLNGNYKSIGFFDNISDAVAARGKEAKKHGFTERHGNV